MHELAIADSIVKTVLMEMEQRSLQHIQAVGVRVGVLTDVVPEALEFSFHAITNGTALSSARLNIEHVPLRGKCRDCGKEVEIEQFLLKEPPFFLFPLVLILDEILCRIHRDLE